MKTKRLLAGICAAAWLSCTAQAAQITDFSDVQGHWAYDALSQAVSAGYLHGSDGFLSPDGSLIGAEMVSILNRVLQTHYEALFYPGVSSEQWYAKDAALGVSAGFLPLDGSLSMDAPVSRAQAMTTLASAFGLLEASPSLDSVLQFSDADGLTAVQKRAIAVLLDDGILSGADETSLEANRDITRAEFITLIFRILDSTWLSFEGEQPASPVQLLIDVPDLSILDDQQQYEQIILRGTPPVFSQSASVCTSRFVLSTTGNGITLDESSGIDADVIVIGAGMGNISLHGNLTTQVEVTSSGRTIDLSGMNLDSLIISGSANQIITDSQTNIQTLTVLGGATDNEIMIQGNIGNAMVYGARTVLSGQGQAQAITVTGARCQVLLQSNLMDDSGVDNGLDGVQISVDLPMVEPGGSIVATAVISGVEQPLTCSAQWYLDGVADPNFANHSFELTDGKVTEYIRGLEFTRNMLLTHTVGLVLTYENPVSGETEKIIAGGDVQIENYPSSYYLPTPEEVFAKVNSTYTPGDWDYEPEEKIVFVNAKGYASDTEYLLWVNRAAQMVNVFYGSQGNWELIHEFECATGKAGSSTPVGVTKVTYKQTAWVTSSYTCRPIVRFYPGTGYAFHSRLYYPGTNTLKDPSIGFPVSAGCVRMLDEGIYWLYENIPSGTTVVIF